MAVPTPIYIAILAGQSNMAGRGGVHSLANGTRHWDGIVPPEAGTPAGSVLCWSASGTWETAAAPLHRDIDTGKVCGVGPGLVFAARLLSTGAARRVGLVPCAIGGTEMDRWVPGADLFEQMIQRTQAALHSLPGTAVLHTLLWYQGESDADTEEHADALSSKFASMVAAARHRLDAPSLPVLQVAITCRNETVAPLAKRVRQHQLALQLPLLRTVDAEGFGLAADGLHLTTASQVRLGTELADVAAGLASDESRACKEAADNAHG